MILGERKVKLFSALFAFLAATAASAGDATCLLGGKDGAFLQYGRYEEEAGVYESQVAFFRVQFTYGEAGRANLARMRIELLDKEQAPLPPVVIRHRVLALEEKDIVTFSYSPYAEPGTSGAPMHALIRKVKKKGEFNAVGRFVELGSSDRVIEAPCSVR